MAEIKSVYRGNGLTELIVIEGQKNKTVRIEKKKKRRVFAWVFLMAVIADLFLGLAVAPFTTKSTIFYVLYWTQAIGLCCLWAYANFIHKKGT